MDIYREIVEKKEAGQSFALATIVRVSGASPRKAGAKMLVFPDGSISGTIGGGAFEKTVIEDCLELLKSDLPPALKRYRFTEQGADATGMYCGGEAEVFIESNSTPKRLVVFGGGHIGREVVKLASDLDFWITVVDDRREVLENYQHPIETILTDSEFGENFPNLDKNSFVVIVTHGHGCDLIVLSKVLKEKCAYVGMIGSKRKVAKTFTSLQDSGVDKSLLDRVHAPIGIDIGGEGPYEIAISIVAEIIAVYRKPASNSDKH